LIRKVPGKYLAGTGFLGEFKNNIRSIGDRVRLKERKRKKARKIRRPGRRII
jgi:hypothetical protein